MKIYPFSFSSHPKSTENLWKIDNFLFARFFPSPFSALLIPIPPLFRHQKKDLKHFRTLSPYSSLFLPAIFRGIFRRFWLGGNQGAQGRCTIRYKCKDATPRHVWRVVVCEQKTIFVTPFTRLARVRITPRRPRAINMILLQMTEAFITDVAGCIVVMLNGHAEARTDDGFDTERLLA